MRLYHCPQVNAGSHNHRECVRWTVPLTGQLKDSDVKIPNAKTLLYPVLNPVLNPVLAPVTHRSLHEELLFCYRRGLLPRKKPELQSVLDKLKETRVKRERPPQTDLDRHLYYRRIRTGALEREQEKRRRQSEPEFVRVKGALKHIPGFCL